MKWWSGLLGTLAIGAYGQDDDSVIDDLVTDAQDRFWSFLTEQGIYVTDEDETTVDLGFAKLAVEPGYFAIEYGSSEISGEITDEELIWNWTGSFVDIPMIDVLSDKSDVDWADYETFSQQVTIPKIALSEIWDGYSCTQEVTLGDHTVEFEASFDYNVNNDRYTITYEHTYDMSDDFPSEVSDLWNEFALNFKASVVAEYKECEIESAKDCDGSVTVTVENKLEDDALLTINLNGHVDAPATCSNDYSKCMLKIEYNYEYNDDHRDESSDGVIKLMSRARANHWTAEIIRDSKPFIKFKVFALNWRKRNMNIRNLPAKWNNCKFLDIKVIYKKAITALARIPTPNQFDKIKDVFEEMTEPINSAFEEATNENDDDDFYANVVYGMVYADRVLTSIANRLDVTDLVDAVGFQSELKITKPEEGDEGFFSTNFFLLSAWAPESFGSLDDHFDFPIMFTDEKIPDFIDNVNTLTQETILGYLIDKVDMVRSEVHRLTGEDGEERFEEVFEYTLEFE